MKAIEERITAKRSIFLLLRWKRSVQMSNSEPSIPINESAPHVHGVHSLRHDANDDSFIAGVIARAQVSSTFLPDSLSERAVVGRHVGVAPHVQVALRNGEVQDKQTTLRTGH